MQISHFDAGQVTFADKARTLGTYPANSKVSNMFQTILVDVDETARSLQRIHVAAFGHSRLCQFVLGAMSRTALASSPVALCMAHQWAALATCTGYWQWPCTLCTMRKI